MKRIPSLFLQAVLIGVPMTVMAQDDLKCPEEPITTVDITTCQFEEYTREDAQMTREYWTLMKKLPPHQKEQLKVAQRAWITYRDTTCAITGAAEAMGTMGTIIRSGCMVTMVQERRQWLQHELSLL